MRLPSLSIHLLNRIYACSTLPWSEILREGDRTERAARHLVALELIEVHHHPVRHLMLSPGGRGELHRRRRRAE